MFQNGTHNLAEQRRTERRDVLTDLLEKVESDQGLLNRVTTGDESWFYQYDQETNCQSSEWRPSNLLRPNEARTSKSKMKYILVCVFILMALFTESGEQIVNKRYYTDIFDRLQKSAKHVRPNIIGNWMLHHNHAPCYHGVFSAAFLFTGHGIV